MKTNEVRLSISGGQVNHQGYSSNPFFSKKERETSPFWGQQKTSSPAFFQPVVQPKPRLSQLNSTFIQRSPLSDQAKTIWEAESDKEKGKGKIFDFLRQSALSGSTGDMDLYTYLKTIFPTGTDDRWLATTLFVHGPEPLWPEGHLTERHRRSTTNQWKPEAGNIEASIGKSATGKHDIKAYFFPGQTDLRALVVGGVHGSELSGVEVVETLLKQLRAAKVKPYYSVIVVPRLFPDNVATAESDPAKIGTNYGRYTCGSKSCEPNRQMPALGTAYDPANNKAAGGQVIEQENIAFLKLIERFKPARVASIHATKVAANAGIYADPRADAFPNSKGEHHALGFDSDAKLAVEMAKRAKTGGAKVPGNKLGNTTPNAIYPLDPAAAKAGDPQKRSTSTGISFGAWGTTAICDTKNPSKNRSAMRVITVEVQKNQRSSDYKDATKAANRKKEIEGHASAIREIFLGPIEVEKANQGACVKASTPGGNTKPPTKP